MLNPLDAMDADTVTFAKLFAALSPEARSDVKRYLEWLKAEAAKAGVQNERS